MREGLIQQILADDRDAYAELVDEHQYAEAEQEREQTGHLGDCNSSRRL